MPKLHARTVGAPEGAEGGAVLRMLHGIYGRGRNWRRFARRFVETHPAWTAELVDLREHGDSRGFEPPHTAEAAAADVVEMGPTPRALLGHSFGGKIALLTLRDPGFRPERVWVVDASPGARTPSGLPWEMIGILRAHPGPFEARAEAVEALESEGVPTPVARWMATNLGRGGDAAPGAGGAPHASRRTTEGEADAAADVDADTDADDLLRWQISADTMESLLRSYFDEDAWDVVEGTADAGTADTEIHFVKASRSDVLGPDDVERIRAAGAGGAGGDVHLHEVDGGHWLHTENPEGLLEVMGKAAG